MTTHQPPGPDAFASTMPIAGTPTAVLDAPPVGAPLALENSPARRRLPRLFIAAVAALALLIAGGAVGIAVGARSADSSSAPQNVLTPEQQAAQAPSVGDALGLLGIPEALTRITQSPDGLTPATAADALDEVIQRLEAASAAGSPSSVTDGLRNVASALKAVERGLRAIDGKSLSSLSNPATLLPLLLGLLSSGATHSN